jgi:glycosyltransferase involved in cell wall biosynthesis
MKILYLCNEVSRKNGWGIINHYTVSEAVDAGHQVYVLTEKDASNEKIDSVAYYPILFKVGKSKRDLLFLISSFVRLKKILSHNNFDVVHILVEPYLIYFSILSHKNIIFNLVGTYSLSIFKDSFFTSLYRISLLKVRCAISISEYTKKVFRQNVYFTQHIVCVPLAVDMTIFNRPPADLALKRPIFTFVGHLKERKGLIYAIQAIKSLVSDYPEIQLYIVGSDKDITGYVKRCKDEILKLGLTDNVKFLGFLKHQSEIAKLYERSIGNILPSVNTLDGAFEGFGLVHLEANACSILTIGSMDCGNESAIIDSVTGFLARQCDSIDLSEKMRKILDFYKEGTYNEHAETCYRYACSNSWKNYFSSIETCYL